MAQIRSITVSFSSSHPTGEWKNVKPSFSMTADLDPGDDFKRVVDAMWKIAKANVRQQVMAATGKQAEEVYNGIPPELAATLKVTTKVVE